MKTSINKTLLLLLHIGFTLIVGKSFKKSEKKIIFFLKPFYVSAIYDKNHISASMY